MTIERNFRTRIGSKVVLHKVSFPETSNEVDRFVVAEIVEEKIVSGDYDRSKLYQGCKAVDSKGKFYFCCWTSFPDDSSSPYWQWFTDSISSNCEFEDI